MSLRNAVLCSPASIVCAASLGSAPSRAEANPTHPDPGSGDTVLTSIRGPRTQLRVTTDGWIVYPSLVESKLSSTVLARTKATDSLVLGKRSAGVCQTEGSTVASVRSHVLVEEVAFNPKTCRSIVRSYATSIAAATSVDGSRTPSMRQKSSAVYTGHTKTLWIDPINITIASQSANATWGSGSTVVAHRADRYGFSGCLGDVCVDRTHLKTSSESAKKSSYSAKAKFQNRAFANWVVLILGAAGWLACGAPTSPLATFKFKDGIKPLPGGKTFLAPYSDSRSGACTNLVHHGSDIGGGWVS